MINLHLSVDDRKIKPFHCDKCGNTYDACIHWSACQICYANTHTTDEHYKDILSNKEMSRG